MKKTIILCLGLILAAGVNVQAQEMVIELSLDKAIEIALDENPTIKIAGLEIERQRYVKKETIGGFLPNIGIAGSYSRAVVKSDMGGGVSFDADNTVGLQGSITMPLFAPALYKTLKLNDEQMKAAVESARGSKITLVNEVKKSYYNLLLAQQSLEVLYASRETISETVEDTRLKFENELASEYDLITAEVQLSNLVPTIIQTQNGIKVARKLLRMYLDLPDNMDIKVVGDLNEYADNAAYKYATPNRDVSYNTDLRSLEIQKDVMTRTLQLQRTQRMPTLAAFGNFSLSGRDPLDMSSLMGSGADSEWQYQGVQYQKLDGTKGIVPFNYNLIPANMTQTQPNTSSDKFMWTNPISVGVQISIPIFAGNSRVNKERQIKYGLQQLDHQKYYLEKSINVQLENAINSTEAAREMMMANKKTIAQAEKGHQISKVRFNEGMGTILELNSSELAMTQAKLNYTQSIFDYLSAQADYEKIIGKEY